LPVPPPPRMNIVVVEGEGAVNPVRNRQPRDIIVQVRDGNRNPVAGATVNFTLPVQGPGGEFLNGSRTLTVTSGEDGRATARGFRPNSAPGKVEIRVSASHDQETATVTVTQFNMQVSRGGSNPGKWIALIGIIGGAAAGGAYAATRGSGSGAAAAPSIITITPGTGAVGRPR
jgi:hypothetical protein